MSQTYNVPLATTDLLSASRVDINDAFDALKTNFLGIVDPTGIEGGLVDGMIWIRSDTNKVRARKAAAIIDLGDFAADMGHLRKDATTPLTADWDVGGFKLTNLAAPAAASDAARKSEVDARLALSGGTLTGTLTLAGDAVGALEAATKQQVDARVARSGDTMTGLLGIPTGVKSANHALRRDEVENLTSFNTSTGHKHTGTDSRKIEAFNLSFGAAAAFTTIESDGAGGAVEKLRPYIIRGQYTGDGTASRNIVPLSGHQAKLRLVLVWRGDNDTAQLLFALSSIDSVGHGLNVKRDGTASGLTLTALAGATKAPDIHTDQISFNVGGNNPGELNNSTVVYRYLAFYSVNV